MTTTSPPVPPDTTSVDPRLRARRIAVARDAGRRRLNRLAILGALLAVVVLAAVLARSPLVSVQTVDIDGASRTPGDAVTQAVGAVKGHPIYAVNTGAIQHRLESAARRQSPIAGRTGNQCRCGAWPAASVTWRRSEAPTPPPFAPERK